MSLYLRNLSLMEEAATVSFHLRVHILRTSERLLRRTITVLSASQTKSTGGKSLRKQLAEGVGILLSLDCGPIFTPLSRFISLDIQEVDTWLTSVCCRACGGGTKK